MKGFTLHDGDLLIANNEIEFVEDTELIAQTLKQVISTNNGEWLFNENEGIDFSIILGKNKNEDEIRSEIESALKQVDETLTLDTCTFDFNKTSRTLKVHFTAKSTSGETVVIDNQWH